MAKSKAAKGRPAAAAEAEMPASTVYYHQHGYASASHPPRYPSRQQYEQIDPQEYEIRRVPAQPAPRCRRKRLRNHISPLLKCLLFSFNFLFWLLGMFISGLGFYIQIEKDKEVRDIVDVFFDPSILMLIAGCIIFMLGFFGCLGALRENICLLKAFHIILTIILLLELLLATLVFVFYYVPSARQQLGFLGPEDNLKMAIVRYRDDDDLRDMIDTIQREFRCCGVSNSDDGFRDWQTNVYFNCSNDNPSVERCGVPHSCCKPNTDAEMINIMCGFKTTNKDRSHAEEKIFTQGCLKGFGMWLERNTIIVGAVCLGIILPQILGICLSRSLIEQINLQMAQWT